MSEQMVTPMESPAPADTTPEGTLDEAVEAEISRLNQRSEVTKAPTKPESEQDTPEEDTADDDNAAEEGADAEPTDDEIVEVEFEGKNYKVPKEIERGLLRQADYTKKTVEVAEARKAVEAYAEDAARMFSAGQEVVQARGFKSMLQADIQKTMQTTNWQELRQNDVVEFSARHADLQMKQQQLADVDAYIARQESVYEEVATKKTHQQVQEGQRVLREIYPEWSETVAKELGSAAMKKGVRLETLQALNDGFDPRALAWIAEMHSKAKRYDAVQSNKVEAKAKAVAAPPVVRAGSAPNQQRTSTEQIGSRLRKSGNVSDAVAYELALMSRRK